MALRGLRRCNARQHRQAAIRPGLWEISDAGAQSQPLGLSCYMRGPVLRCLRCSRGAQASEQPSMLQAQHGLAEKAVGVACCLPAPCPATNNPMRKAEPGCWVQGLGFNPRP